MGVVAVFAVSGFGGGFLNPILAAVSYERVPRRMLGPGQRAGGLAGLGRASRSAGCWPGRRSPAAGLAPVLVACGAAYFLTTNLTALRPEWREMDRLRGRGRPAVPEGAGTAG